MLRFHLRRNITAGRVELTISLMFRHLRSKNASVSPQVKSYRRQSIIRIFTVVLPWFHMSPMHQQLKKNACTVRWQSTGHTKHLCSCSTGPAQGAVLWSRVELLRSCGAQRTGHFTAGKERFLRSCGARGNGDFTAGKEEMLRSRTCSHSDLLTQE